MGHCIKCIIGSDKVIEQMADNWVHAKNVSLKNGFSLIPMTDDLFDDINELTNEEANSSYVEFDYFSSSIEQALKEQSYSEKIAYIETDYFGGTGSQSAISYFKGEISVGPLQTRTDWDEKKSCHVISPEGERAINLILYSMGIEKRFDIDAFDTLGLRNYRSNEKIVGNL